LAAVTKKSSQVPPASSVPPIASRVTRNQGKAPTEALTASAATGDSFTYAEAMESPQQDDWKKAMQEESTSILLNNLYLRSDGILILLYVDDMSMSYPEAATKAAIEVNAKLREI
jgi:hypothetical protein